MAEDTPNPTAGSPDTAELQMLHAKINAILPSLYQHCYDEVEPVSMGSAGLKYGPDGKVAWDEIWTSFCDLALAGGPPHRGTLLEPGSADACLAEPEKYQQVVEEIGRGIWLVSRLPVLPRLAPGWVGVRCPDATMAAWLVRAIVVENIFARQEQTMLLLPAGPHFQLTKEIKNIITTLAKTCHYWTCHMSADQQASAAAVMKGSDTGELISPAFPDEIRAATSQYHSVVREIENRLPQTTALKLLTGKYLGWVGVGCINVPTAVWLMRAMIVDNILVRREADVLYLPAAPRFPERDCQRMADSLARAWRLWGRTQTAG